MVKIDLIDQAGYPVESVEVPEPLAPVQIWGDAVYMVQADGKFRDVPFNVIQDTSDSGVHKLRL